MQRVPRESRRTAPDRSLRWKLPICPPTQRKSCQWLCQFYQAQNLDFRTKSSSEKYIANDIIDMLHKAPIEGKPEPLEKDINEIFGSKREDRLSDPFFEMVHNATLIRFSYLLRLCNFCKATRDLQKFLQKFQKIAGC